ATRRSGPVGMLGNEAKSSIAMSPDGRFAVAYQFTSTGGTQSDIFMKRFDAFGNVLTAPAIAFSGDSERNPSVAMDSSGNAVVAWERAGPGNSFDIKARRVSNAGTLSAELSIRNTTAAEASPTVAMNRTGLAFVVAYHTLTAGGGQTVEVDEIDANNINRNHFTLPGRNLFA